MVTLNIQEKEMHFVAWCVEVYAAEQHIDAQRLANEWYQRKVFAYLLECYDVLHTQGKDYIFGEIERFLASQNND